MGITEHNLGKVVGPPGNLNDSTASFSQAATRENINTGEKGSTIFGKIGKWFADTRSAAFAELTQSLAVTAAGYAMDARVGKILDQKIAALNSTLGEAIGNMKMVCVNQKGSYTFSLPEGKMAVVITYRGIYPHYSSSGGIYANQLVNKDENVITAANNTDRTVSVYAIDGKSATQAVILMPI